MQKNPFVIKLYVQVIKNDKGNFIKLTGINGFKFKAMEKIPPFSSGSKEIIIHKKIYLSVIENFEGHFFVEIKHLFLVSGYYWIKTITKNDNRRYIATVNPLQVIDELIEFTNKSRQNAERRREYG